ncbi:hypothetical protein VU08_00760 [Desulfobulbus sp. F5]|nr:hypothetical protein [Desulfobulbus sp. F5]
MTSSLQIKGLNSLADNLGTPTESFSLRIIERQGQCGQYAFTTDQMWK